MRRMYEGHGRVAFLKEKLYRENNDTLERISACYFIGGVI